MESVDGLGPETARDLSLIRHSLVLARAEFFLSSSYVHARKDYPYITERYQLTVEAMGRVIRKGQEQGVSAPIGTGSHSAVYDLVSERTHAGYLPTRTDDDLRTGAVGNVHPIS